MTDIGGGLKNTADVENKCCYAKSCVLFKFVLLEMQTRPISSHGCAIHLLTILHEIHFSMISLKFISHFKTQKLMKKEMIPQLQTLN